MLESVPKNYEHQKKLCFVKAYLNLRNLKTRGVCNDKETIFGIALNSKDVIVYVRLWIYYMFVDYIFTVQIIEKV